MVRMKALKSWTGEEGPISAGNEFNARNEYRAKDLEAHGLAHRVKPPAEATPLTKIGNVPETNKAAETGPLASAGGATGAEAPAPSSPPARQRRKRRSKASKDADLLS